MRCRGVGPGPPAHPSNCSRSTAAGLLLPLVLLQWLPMFTLRGLPCWGGGLLNATSPPSAAMVPLQPSLPPLQPEATVPPVPQLAAAPPPPPLLAAASPPLPPLIESHSLLEVPARRAARRPRRRALRWPNPCALHCRCHCCCRSCRLASMPLSRGDTRLAHAAGFVQTGLPLAPLCAWAAVPAAFGCCCCCSCCCPGA